MEIFSGAQDLMFFFPPMFAATTSSCLAQTEEAAGVSTGEKGTATLREPRGLVQHDADSKDKGENKSVSYGSYQQ